MHSDTSAPWRIDCHNHPDWHGHDLEAFLRNMDACGIERTWLLSWECPPNDWAGTYNAVTHGALLGQAGEGPIPFARGLSYVERAPERFVLGYCPDPQRPDALDRLAAAVEIYGARVCGELKVRLAYDNPDVLRLFRFCGERKLPVILHLDDPRPGERAYPRRDYWYGGSIHALERALRACPETIFLAHAPAFWACISGDYTPDGPSYPEGPVTPGGELPRMLRTYPNLYCDLSAGSGRRALQRDPAFAKEFLQEFGDRLLYGRDFFDNDLWTFLEGLEPGEDLLRRIGRENALRLVPDRTG